jgi:hypothetical protein
MMPHFRKDYYLHGIEFMKVNIIIPWINVLSFKIQKSLKGEVLIVENSASFREDDRQ